MEDKNLEIAVPSGQINSMMILYKMDNNLFKITLAKNSLKLNTESKLYRIYLNLNQNH